VCWEELTVRADLESGPVLAPSRRTITRAAAWTVPVVAVSPTAPAYAASPCDPRAGAVDWGDASRYNRAGAASATYTVPDPDGAGPGQALTLTITNTFLGSNTRLGGQPGLFGGAPANDNLRTTTGVGGSGSGATSLELHQSPISDNQKVGTWTGTSNKSITTFTFSRAVTNLTFTICDIDSAQNDFWDGIALAGAPFTSGKANATYVLGDGSTGNPFRADNGNRPIGDNSTDGNVTITMPSVTSFEFHYWNLSSSSSWLVDDDQAVYLSGFTFDYKPC